MKDKKGTLSKSLLSRLKIKKPSNKTPECATAAQEQEGDGKDVNAINPMWDSATTGNGEVVPRKAIEPTALPTAPTTARSTTSTLPNGWTAHTDANGTPYYHNKSSCETSWTMPMAHNTNL